MLGISGSLNLCFDNLTGDGASKVNESKTVLQHFSEQSTSLIKIKKIPQNAHEYLAILRTWPFGIVKWPFRRLLVTSN